MINCAMTNATFTINVLLCCGCNLSCGRYNGSLCDGQIACIHFVFITLANLASQTVMTTDFSLYEFTCIAKILRQCLNTCHTFN